MLSLATSRSKTPSAQPSDPNIRLGFGETAARRSFFFACGTGRALQAENDDLEKVGPALLYPAYDGALELLAILDIRARSISFTTRPRRPEGPPDHERAGETFFSISSFRLADLGGKPLLLLGLA
jgi:hypothetical protein